METGPVSPGGDIWKIRANNCKSLPSSSMMVPLSAVVLSGGCLLQFANMPHSSSDEEKMEYEHRFH